MEKYKVGCIIGLYYLFIFEVVSQSSVTFYSGINISKSTYTSENIATNIDSSGTLGNSSVRPNFGVDIEFDISEKLILSTGLGVSMLGTRDYIDYDIPEGINIDKNLKLDYLSLPLEIKLKLIDNIGIMGGYSLNYCYRKNLNFFNFKIGSSSLSNIFSEIYHAFNFGLFFREKKWQVSVNYQIGLNRVWDTGNFYEIRRDYVTLNSLLIKLGYTLPDK